MTDHTVSSFDLELKDLAGQIAEMGGLAEGLVADSITALVRGDTALAQKVIASDLRLDRLQHQVEENAIRIIARRQPMARDLREIFGAMRISSDLERVGDLAKNIAKRVISMGGVVQIKRIVIGVEHLAEIALEQLKNVLDSYTSRDSAGALLVRVRDD
jgi:phosphate transport system protein